VKRLLVTGANGHLGRRLLGAAEAAGAAGEGWTTRAVVRSERAAAALAGHGDVRIVDYADAAGLAAACADCAAVVHLVGIIKETRSATYDAAHVDATAALADAAEQANVQRIVYLSIIGADAASANRCLRSKAQAEALLEGSSVPSLVLRVPMVLGEGDAASAALMRSASGGVAFSFRAASLEQPIYAGDVIEAVLAGVAPDAPTGLLELAGPHAMTRRALIRAAAERPVRVISLPITLGYTLAWTLQKATANPPVTTDMLGVLDHDDDVDPEPAAEALGIRLASLEETLARIRQHAVAAPG
jgi:NADH dehydrogenase